jgi:hypothetical protein
LGGLYAFWTTFNHNFYKESSLHWLTKYFPHFVKAKDGDFFISDWLRNRNTIEFLGIWEQIHNPNFNYGEFAIIKSQAGLNRYKISVKEWAAKTNAIGLRAMPDDMVGPTHIRISHLSLACGSALNSKFI